MTELRTTPAKNFPLQKIILAGLLVGTLDIAAALTDYYITTGKSPVGVLKYIASGVFGREKAFGTEGNSMVILGLLFHYIIAMLFTFFFFRLYPRFELMSRNRVVTGLLYGLFAWIIMTFIVTRLSNTPHTPISAIKPMKALKAILILCFMIGIPLSFIAYRHYKSQGVRV